MDGNILWKLTNSSKLSVFQKMLPGYSRWSCKQECKSNFSHSISKIWWSWKRVDMINSTQSYFHFLNEIINEKFTVSHPVIFTFTIFSWDIFMPMKIFMIFDKHGKWWAASNYHYFNILTKNLANTRQRIHKHENLRIIFGHIIYHFKLENIHHQILWNKDCM